MVKHLIDLIVYFYKQRSFLCLKMMLMDLLNSIIDVLNKLYQPVSILYDHPVVIPYEHL